MGAFSSVSDDSPRSRPSSLSIARAIRSVLRSSSSPCSRSRKNTSSSTADSSKSPATHVNAVRFSAHVASADPASVKCAISVGVQYDKPLCLRKLLLTWNQFCYGDLRPEQGAFVLLTGSFDICDCNSYFFEYIDEGLGQYADNHNDMNNDGGNSNTTIKANSNNSNSRNNETSKASSNKRKGSCNNDSSKKNTNKESVVSITAKGNKSNKTTKTQK